MSNKYPQFTNTQFPDQLDEFELKREPRADELTDINYYQERLSAGDMQGANQFLGNKPNLQQVIINAAFFNKIIDAIKAIQKYYKEDVQPLLNNVKQDIQQTITNGVQAINQTKESALSAISTSKDSAIQSVDNKKTEAINAVENKIESMVNYRGLYSNSATYAKYDIVTYSINGDLFAYLCTKNAPQGTLPTNGSFFIKLGYKGDKGDSGTGLVPKGVWQAGTYKKNDLVSRNNKWYQCLSNTSDTPPSANWVEILSGGSSTWSDIQGKPSTFPPSTHTHSNYLTTGGKAYDSGRLAGRLASDYLLTTGKAADSHRLNGVDITGFTQFKGETMSLTDLQNTKYPYPYSCTTSLGKQLGLPVDWVNIVFFRHRANGYGTQLAFPCVQSNSQADTNYFFMAKRQGNEPSFNAWQFIGTHESISIKDTKLAIRNGHTYNAVYNATVDMPWGVNNDDGVIIPHIAYYNSDGTPQWGWQTFFCWNRNEIWVRRINASAWQAWEKIPKWGDLESLKQLSVDGKNTHINGINRLMGYNSGLTTTNTWNDVAWWWEHKVLKEKGNSFSKSYQLKNEQYQSSDDSMDFAIRFNAKELPTLATVNIPAGQTINYTIPQGVSAIAITQKYRNFSSLGFGGSTVISTNILDRERDGTYELSGGWRGFTPQKSSEGFWRGMVITRIYPNRIIQFQNRFGSNTLTAYIKLLF